MTTDARRGPDDAASHDNTGIITESRDSARHLVEVVRLAQRETKVVDSGSTRRPIPPPAGKVMLLRTTWVPATLAKGFDRASTRRRQETDIHADRYAESGDRIPRRPRNGGA